MNTYTYKDNNNGGELVFKCEAGNILEADEKFKKAIGKDVVKMMYVACSIEFNVNKKEVVS